MTETSNPLKKPRRFYTSVSSAPAQGGHAVLLDGRAVRTPAGAPLVAPSAALADLLASDWAAQGPSIDMAAMPAVRLAFTAIDRVSTAREDVAAEIVRYAASDTLCYFAQHPQSLAERQGRGWGPVLEWVGADLKVDLVRVVGVMPAAQPEPSLRRIAQLAEALDDFALAGLAHATALFGSAILAFAVQRQHLSGQSALDLSRLDETFQAEFWGLDAEAAIRAEGQRADATMLERWFRALT